MGFFGIFYGAFLDKEIPMDEFLVFICLSTRFCSASKADRRHIL